MRNHSGYGRVRLAEGIVLIALGVLTLVRPNLVYTSAVVIYAILAVGLGVLDLVAYVRQEVFFGFGPVLSLITGILSVMTGCMLLLHQDAGKAVLLILFPLWFIAHCVSRLTRLNYIRFTFGNLHYYFSPIINIIGICLGFVMLFEPRIAFITLGGVLGLYLILLGVGSVWLSISRKGSL
ncbi:MAG: DUF308 domain-containing protein [Lachnospiraceae bacterium]|nr:DUF308 domain-containing protein [Lachnospiraceae bacterium]